LSIEIKGQLEEFSRIFLNKCFEKGINRNGSGDIVKEFQVGFYCADFL
jgi:hypothetical protein